MMKFLPLIFLILYVGSLFLHKYIKKYLSESTYNILRIITLIIMILTLVITFLVLFIN